MRYKYHRDFLKSNFNDFKSIKTDKIKGIPQPLINKDYDNSHIIIPLPSVDKNILSKENVFECIESRRSTRFFSEEGISLEELSFLLWSTQLLEPEYVRPSRPERISELIPSFS